WAPNCAEWVLVQYATAKAGIILVNINPAYRSHELSYVLRQSGVRLLISAEAFKSSDYRGMIDEVRNGLEELEQVIYLRSAEWGALMAAGRHLGEAAGRHLGEAAGEHPGGSGGPADRARSHPVLRRPDQHPVHERHDGLPQGRDAFAPQHPEQRLLHRGGLRLHRA